MTVPLTAPDGEENGFLRLIGRREADFLPFDEAVLQQLAQIVSAALHKTRLYEERSHVARVLQRSLLPPALPVIPGVELVARYLPGAEEVGGDFYDAFPLAGSSWAVTLGDVCGKGPEAAAVTALTRHTMRTAVLLGSTPPQTFSVLNRALRSSDADGRFVSAVLVTLDRLDDGAVEATFASAGHPPALVRRSGGPVEELMSTGPLLGVFDEVRVATSSVRLAPGDTLLLYTDGVTEARRDGDVFGETRLTALLADGGGAGARDADATADRITGAVAAFGDGRSSDDLALVVLRVTGPAG
jgi:phosphoserine phosphatase RsbU/P